MNKLKFFSKNKQENLASIQGGIFGREKSQGGSYCVENQSGQGSYEVTYSSDVTLRNGQVRYRNMELN